MCKRGDRQEGFGVEGCGEFGKLHKEGGEGKEDGNLGTNGDK